MTDETDDVRPIAWMAIPERHPVLSAEGEIVGYGAAVLGDMGNGRWDGLVVGIDLKLKRDPRLMLEVDQVDELLSDGVHTNLTADEIRALPEYTTDQVWGASRKGGIARVLDGLGGDHSSAWDRKQ